MTRPVRTLLFSTLYPSASRPTHGIFVETRLRELLKSGAVETRVVAPVPWFWSTDERWGERAAAIAEGLAEPPPLDVTLRDPAETAIWAERLGGVSLMPGHVRLPRGEAIERLPGFKEGAWWVQDLAASLPARLLGAGEGRNVLDLCAAPGGKTLQLAAAGWQVTALDASAKRLGRLRENIARAQLAALTPAR